MAKLVAHFLWIAIAAYGFMFVGADNSGATERSPMRPIVQEQEDGGTNFSKEKGLSDEAYDHALELVRLNNFRKAYESLTVAIQHDPDNALAYAARARVRSMFGDQLGSIGDADHAIALDPTMAFVYYNRGIIYARMRLWLGAADDFATAAFLDPDLGGGIVFSDLGTALMAQGRYGEAIANYSRAIGRTSAPAVSYFNRSIAYERSGQLDAAISDMNAVIESVPSFAEAYHRRALLFRRKVFHGQAIRDLDTALRLDPDDLVALEDRAALHKRLGHVAAAQEDFKRSAEKSRVTRNLDRDTHVAPFLSQ